MEWKRRTSAIGRVIYQQSVQCRCDLKTPGFTSECNVEIGEVISEIVIIIYLCYFEGYNLISVIIIMSLSKQLQVILIAL